MQDMQYHLYLPTLLLILGTVLVVFAMKYVSAAIQARTRDANERSYRALAEQANALQSQHAAALSTLQSTVAEIGTRLGQVEKILKDVG